jgi:hypothetical protein
MLSRVMKLPFSEHGRNCVKMTAGCLEHSEDADLPAALRPRLLAYDTRAAADIRALHAFQSCIIKRISSS